MKSGKKKSGGIKNNPRLKFRTSKDDSDEDESKSAVNDYQFVVNCLCDESIVLKPQEILEYIAMTIKIYIGTSLTLNMHQRTFVINSKMSNKHLLKSLQTNNREQNIQTSMQLSLPINIKELHEFTRIGLIIPIIYQKPPKGMEDSKENRNYYRNNSRDAIAILQERKTRLSFNDFRKGILFPYVLNNERYEWYVSNNLYLTTIQKNYNWQRALIQNETANDARRSHFEQTFLAYSYGKTRNVTKSIILCSEYDSNMKLCLFSTVNGLFYTDPRLCYNYYDKNDTNYNYEMNISIPLLYREVFDRSEQAIFVDFWTQGMNDIYILNSNNNVLYNVCFNVSALDKYNEIPPSYGNNNQMPMGYQNQMQQNRGGNNPQNAHPSQLWQCSMCSYQNSPYAQVCNMCLQGKKNQIQPMQPSDNKDENEFEEENANDSDPQKMNEILQKHSLLTVNKMYTIDTKKSIFSQAVKPHGDHCETKAVYYENGVGEYVEGVYWVEKSKRFGNWRIGGIARENVFGSSKQKSIHSRLRTKEKQFWQSAPKDITQETFYIAFVDDRDVNEKKFVIILKNHIVTVPLLKKSEIDNEHNTKPFGQCLEVKDIAPEVLIVNEQIRFDAINHWHYNYSNHTLYIFERMGAGVYPFRMNEIAINAFKFD